MNHRSYQDYVDEIISLIPENMDKDFIELYEQQILPIAEKSWIDHLCGKKENYLLSDEDIEYAWTKANIQMVENSMIKLSQLGLIDMSINEKGEILYGISEKGSDYLKSLND